MGKASRIKKKKPRTQEVIQPPEYAEEQAVSERPPAIFGSFTRNILLVFLFAFAVRLIFLFQFRTEPFFDFPILDSELYSNWAKAIARGDWIGKDVFFVSPLYAYFLAVLYKIVNFKIFWVVFMQFLLGALNCVLVYLIGRKLFGEVVGILSGLFASLYGYFMFIEVQLLKNSLAYILTTLSFYLFLLAREKQKPVLWGVLGISTALTALAIPNMLAVIPFLYCAIVFDKRARQKMLLKLVMLTIGICMIVAPVTIRNYSVGKDWVLISSNGGINLFLGTDPETDGGLRTSKVIEQAPEFEERSSKSIAEKDLKRELRPSEISSYWSSRALDTITGNLSASVQLFFRKLYRFWRWRELTDNLDFYYFKEKYLLLGVPFMNFGVIVPLAILGLLLSRRQKEILIPALVLIVVFTLSSIPFPIYGRYRTPIVPVLIVFSAYGMYALYRLVRQKKWDGIAVASIVLFVSLTVLNLGKRENNFSFMYRVMGQIYLKKKEPEKAVLALKDAVQADPRNFYTRNALGLLYAEMGKYDEAIEEFKQAVRLSPKFVAAHYNLGLAYFKSGDRLAAFEEFKVVMENDTTGSRKEMIRKLLMGDNR